MRNAIFTVAMFALSAVPSWASVSYSDIYITLDGPGIHKTVDADSLSDDPGQLANGWYFAADVVTDATPDGDGFTSPNTFTADLTDFTLECENGGGCGATTISFDVEAFLTSDVVRTVPWQVEIIGTTAGLNATFSGSLTSQTANVAGNRSFDFIKDGFTTIDGAAGFNTSISVPRGEFGETLTLPLDVTFGSPEPATLGLTGVFLAGLGLMTFRRRKQR
jgi:hypothetical protein